jgi:hypothetical protein
VGVALPCGGRGILPGKRKLTRVLPPLLDPFAMEYVHCLHFLMLGPFSTRIEYAFFTIVCAKQSSELDISIRAGYISPYVLLSESNLHTFETIDIEVLLQPKTGILVPSGHISTQLLQVAIIVNPSSICLVALIQC